MSLDIDLTFSDLAPAIACRSGGQKGAAAGKRVSPAAEASSGFFEPKKQPCMSLDLSHPTLTHRHHRASSWVLAQKAAGRSDHAQLDTLKSDALCDSAFCQHVGLDALSHRGGSRQRSFNAADTPRTASRRPHLCHPRSEPVAQTDERSCSPDPHLQTTRRIESLPYHFRRCGSDAESRTVQ